MNTIAKTHSTLRSQPNATMAGRVLPFLGACLATLLALPVNAAVTWPENPLQSAAPTPPNILFITDNSASMTLVSMPYGAKDWEYDDDEYKDQRDGGGATDVGLWDEPYNRSYLNNTIYYDPSVDYDPWIKADGTRYTDGTSIDHVIGDWNQVAQPFSDTHDSTNAMYRNLVNDDEAIFYVPHTGVSQLPSKKSTYHDDTATDGDINTVNDADYDRYMVFNDGTGAKVMKTSANPTILQSFVATSPGADIPAHGWKQYTISVPANTTTLRVTINPGLNNKGKPIEAGDADLYLRFGANPTTTTYDFRNWDTNNAQQITLVNPTIGTWHIGVYNKDGSTAVNNLQVEALALNDHLTAAVPVTARNPSGDQAKELENIATWYSYYRTRLKTAKGGASEAFYPIGPGNRVAYVPLNKNGRQANLESGLVIPVDKNNGRFEDHGADKNKSDWFKAVQEEVVPESTTPLRIVLDEVGRYFQRSDIKGPWSDGVTSNDLTCRHSAAILTTDGYWTDDNQSAPYPYYTEDGKAGVTTDVDGDGNTESDGGPDTTLADIAMHYYQTDLRSDLADNVPVSTQDPNAFQHMNTYSISIGAEGSMAMTDPPPDNITGNADADWTNPLTTGGAARIDDLWHAAVNGGGTFTVASSPKQFAEALTDALAAIAGQAGSAANISTNSLSSQTGSAVYQASYTPGTWTGELKAFTITNGTIAATPAWTASTLVPPYGSRNIVTSDGSAGAAFPTTAQVSALARATGLAPVSGLDNAHYLMGEQIHEKSHTGEKLRTRATVLGDIVNSSPLYLEEGTTKTLFAGGNDGMLHAFNATTGVEQFAYIPYGLDFSGTTGLGALSDPQYLHDWFVDGPMVVTTKAMSAPDNKNYLVGALGRGGKGLFGLDVTTPSGFSTGSVLWDMTGSAAPTNMGQVIGQPFLARLNGAGHPLAVIVGNGVNSTGDTASLFIINVKTGAVIKELDTGATGGNGLSEPRGWDDNGDGYVDYVYAGDMQGNVWKFDLSSNSSASWVISNSGSPVFTTPSGQPISAGLALAENPADTKRWVFFGTGKFLETADVSDLSVQSMYGVMDDTTKTTNTTLHQADLQQRNIIVTDTLNGKDVRGFEANTPLPAAAHGWYIDMDEPANQGERMVVRPLLVNNVLLNTSMIPPGQNADPCKPGGSGYLNALDPFTGTSTSEPFFDANGDGKIDGDDTVGGVPVGSIDLGVGMPTLPAIIGDTIIVGGSDAGVPATIKFKLPGNTQGRVSWREILGD